jgi:hypothetical protein
MTKFMKNKAISLKFIIVFLFVTLIACFPNKVYLSDEIVKVKLLDITNNPSQFINKKVEIKGKFIGLTDQKGIFIKDHANQITDNDKAFKDLDGSCIYVSKMPAEVIHPLGPGTAGKNITLIARVKTDHSGKLYLEYISVN